MAEQLVDLLIQGAAEVGSYLGTEMRLTAQGAVYHLREELLRRLAQQEMLREDLRDAARAASEDGSDA